MANYARRSGLPERMDDPSIPAEEMARAFDELETINLFLGGYRASLTGVARLLPRGCRSFTLLDVGVGCGDFPRRLVAWSRRRGTLARVKGIDLLPSVVRHATERCLGFPEIDLEVGDALAIRGERAFDVVHASLILHHLDDTSAPRLLRRMYELSRLGIVVNDLHRHPVAYHSIRLFSRLLSMSHLIRHDGPVSVLRAFRKRDLEALVSAAGLPPPRIRWSQGFRWQVVVPR